MRPLLNQRRTRGQFLLSIATGVVLVAVLAVLNATLEGTPYLAATGGMALAGMILIYLFDEQDRRTWPSDLADYLTIVGLIGLWSGLVEGAWGWLVGIPFYWGLSTLVRRFKHER